MALKDDARSVSIDMQGQVLREQLGRSRYLMGTPGRFGSPRYGDHADVCHI
jgi:hypothetical protein